MRSFDCDMYWPLLNMYWESSGFLLRGFYIRVGLLLGGRGYHISTTMKEDRNAIGIFFKFQYQYWMLIFSVHIDVAINIQTGTTTNITIQIQTSIITIINIADNIRFCRIFAPTAIHISITMNSYTNIDTNTKTSKVHIITNISRMRKEG